MTYPGSIALWPHRLLAGIARTVAATVAVLIMLAVMAGQLPGDRFAYDPRTCCCDQAGPCPCKDHELPDHEEDPVARSCGSGGNYLQGVAAPTLALPPLPPVFVAHATPIAPVGSATTPHPVPDIDRPRGPS